MVILYRAWNTAKSPVFYDRNAPEVPQDLFVISEGCELELLTIGPYKPTKDSRRRRHGTLEHNNSSALYVLRIVMYCTMVLQRRRWPGARDLEHPTRQRDLHTHKP